MNTLQCDVVTTLLLPFTLNFLCLQNRAHFDRIPHKTNNTAMLLVRKRMYFILVKPRLIK